jgi:GNAT superfamily N-acetyltransferase
MFLVCGSGDHPARHPLLCKTAASHNLVIDAQFPGARYDRASESASTACVLSAIMGEDSASWRLEMEETDHALRGVIRRAHAFSLAAAGEPACVTARSGWYDMWFGDYIILESSSARGLAFLESLALREGVAGKSALIRHEKKVVQLATGMRLEVETGALSDRLVRTLVPLRGRLSPRAVTAAEEGSCGPAWNEISCEAAGGCMGGLQDPALKQEFLLLNFFQEAEKQLRELAGPGEGRRLAIATLDEPDPLAEALSTHVRLFDPAGVFVAFAHVAYSDHCALTTIGPSVEGLQVKKGHWGKGYSMVLYRALESHVLSTWHLRRTCDPPDCCVLKATNLRGVIVDANPKLKGQKPLTDARFFLKHCGFSANLGFKPDGRLPEMATKHILGRSPCENLYKLLSPQSLPPAPLRSGVCVKFYGSVSCEYCNGSKEHSEMECCGQCKDVYYCDTACQKSDWKFHKLWCCSTPAAMHAKLVAGGFRKQENGTWYDKSMFGGSFEPSETTL